MGRPQHTSPMAPLSITLRMSAIAGKKRDHTWWPKVVKGGEGCGRGVNGVWTGCGRGVDGVWTGCGRGVEGWDHQTPQPTRRVGPAGCCDRGHFGSDRAVVLRGKRRAAAAART